MWNKIWLTLLDELGKADAIDWSTSAKDSGIVRALLGRRRSAESDGLGQERFETPRDRGRLRESVGNRSYWRKGAQFPAAIPRVDAILLIKTLDGGRRKRPAKCWVSELTMRRRKPATNSLVQESNR